MNDQDKIAKGIEAASMYDAGVPLYRIALKLGISVPTVQRYIAASRNAIKKKGALQAEGTK